jgi:hypothetical protein
LFDNKNHTSEYPLQQKESAGGGQLIHIKTVWDHLRYADANASHGAVGRFMKRFFVILVGILNTVFLAKAADLSTAPSQDLLAIYSQLRSIQGSRQYASVEEVVFKRDVATFTLLRGYITFAEPIAGQVLAAQFEGEGLFELAPVSPVDQRQISRFAEGPKLVDTFHEAVFFFTDDTFEEMNKRMRVRVGEKAREARFASIQKKYAENFNNWVDNQRKGNPAMRNMAARMLADLTDQSSKGFFLADFKGDKSGDLLFHISWNRDPLLLLHTRVSDEVILLHVNPGDYFEWWSGFRLSHEYEISPYPDPRDLHVHSPEARIDLEVAKNERISATAQLDYVVRESSPRVLPFNLSGVLRISSIEDGSGNQLTYIQEDRKRDNDPWVILAAPANPGKRYKIKIRYKEDSTYESRIVHDHGGSQYLVASRDLWYPSFGRFDDRTQYEINVRSPKAFKMVASGAQTKSEKNKDTLETSWKSEVPVGSVGFSYGDFVAESQVIHDLKMTAYAGRNLPNDLRAMVTQFDRVNFGSSFDARLMRGGLNTTARVKNAIGQSIQAFKLFEFLFGKLEFKTISVVQQPIGLSSGGWPNMVVVPYTYFLDSTIKNQLGLLQTAEQREYQRTVAIQGMAYQWFEHLVNGKTYRDQWLRDGGVDFASLMYLRQFEPSELDGFWNIRRKWLLSKNSLGYRPVDAGPIWLNSQLNEYNAEGNSGYVNRYKGGYILEMLRVLMYDPKLDNPDARFITMMRDFTSTYAGQNVSTQDFQRIVEKHIGKSMQWFFDQWVYGSETPTYDFGYQFSDAEDGNTKLSISLTQSDVSESFHMQLPLYVVLDGERRYLGLLGVTGTKPLSTSVSLRKRPEKALLDPDRSILAEIHQ